MKKIVGLATFLAALPVFPAYAGDDMLAAAMKKIAELEAANKAKDAEISRLKSKPVAHAIKAETHPVSKKAVITHAAPAPAPVAATPALSATQEHSLAGLYGGINGGYGGGDVSTYGESFSLDALNGKLIPGFYSKGSSTSRFGGALAGGQVGYNFITPTHVLLGGEVDMDWADISNNSNSGFGMFQQSSGVSATQGGRDGLKWLGTARARLGYQIGSLVPYVTGGLAFGEASSYARIYQAQGGATFWTGSVSEASGSKTSVGFAAGAGVEYAVTQNVSLKTEYLYTQISSAFPKGTATTGVVFSGGPIMVSAQLPAGYSDQLGLHQVRFGLNYHLHLDEPAAVVAKF